MQLALIDQTRKTMATANRMLVEPLTFPRRNSHQ
jgi:hypothetical protein